MFEVRLSEEAIKSYDIADSKTVQRLNKVFENISDNPFFGPHIRKLRGKLSGSYRYKLGSIRQDSMDRIYKNKREVLQMSVDKGGIMGFLKQPKVWSNIDLGLFKWSCIFFGIIMGAYISQIVKNWLWIFILTAVALGIKPIIDYWKK